jgi:hypothetical protein
MSWHHVKRFAANIPLAVFAKARPPVILTKHKALLALKYEALSARGLAASPKLAAFS